MATRTEQILTQYDNASVAAVTGDQPAPPPTGVAVLLAMFWAAVTGLLGSKKFLATALAAITYVVGRLAPAIDPAVIEKIWEALMVFVAAQGAADLGKGRAIVEAKAKVAAVAAAAAAAPPTA